MTQQNLFTDPPTPPASDNPLCGLHTTCRRCGCTKFVDVVLHAQPHAGRSTRRDCANCGWHFGFSIWYGKPTEPTR